MRTIRNGAYTLEASILNPIADGRSRNDWRKAPTFEPGRYFVTVYVHVDEPRSAYSFSTRIVFRTINVRRSLRDSGIEFNARQLDNLSSESGQGFKALLDALVVDDSLDSAIRFAEIEGHVDPVDVLLRLVEAGVVSDDAVRLALQGGKRCGS